MSKIGTREAAELTGRSRATIYRAMEDGRLSYDLDPSGERIVAVSELERVFGSLKIEKQKDKDTISTYAQLLLEKQKNSFLEQQIENLKQQLSKTESDILNIQTEKERWYEEYKAVRVLPMRKEPTGIKRVLEKIFN